MERSLGLETQYTANSIIHTNLHPAERTILNTVLLVVFNKLAFMVMSPKVIGPPAGCMFVCIMDLCCVLSPTQDYIVGNHAVLPVCVTVQVSVVGH